MKRFPALCAIALLAFVFSGYSVSGQVELPRKSPRASVSYTVGLTDITIRYSSPAVSGRAIWGALVPYNQIWRAGANEATTIEFSTDVKIEGRFLPKGKYTFFLIPLERETWTAVFNRFVEQWGAYSYDESQDALRTPVRVNTSDYSEERLSYHLSDAGLGRGYIRLWWEKRQVFVHIETDVIRQVLNNMELNISNAAEERKWELYTQAADFLINSGDENYLDQALQYANLSTSLLNHSWNWWVKAQVLAKKGEYRQAVSSANKSIDAGKNNTGDSFFANAKGHIEQAISEWKSKI
ncbi:MAG: DUF2911 domain-containing protein [Saprospiraceae bacterium]|nr:DUF2911 domain-containing protein [Saprospiraceae bacterium]MDZ4703300.1 DUF2911 domain-containing protein [Saprospiraceae bacterium]